MKIIVFAKPNSAQEKIEKTSENEYRVWVKEPPRNGKANRAIIRALAEYFTVAPSQIILVSGFFSKNKIFDIRK